MLPWLAKGHVPLYLAPMAGVTDLVFRQICKELGADVMVTEFVSAEGIMHRDDRTRHYTEFTESQRPLGVQLFGAHPANLAEAAKKIIDWKQPDFIDINFGCPVNKVVSKNGGSSLLRDCPLLCSVGEALVKAVPIPVTAKIRIGWDESTINAPHVVKLLENCGIQAVAIHGRTRAQGYSGMANWDVIGECAAQARIPVIGNGDLATGADVQCRMATTAVRGLMIGRAAMQNPWVFQEARAYLATGRQPPPPTLEQRWELIHRHVRMSLESKIYGDERHTLQAMRNRLMAYTKGLIGGKHLRPKLSQVTSAMAVEEIAAWHTAQLERWQEERSAFTETVW